MEAKEKNIFDSEGKKGTGMFPNLVPEDGDKRGIFGETLSGFINANKGMFTSVPTDEEIKILMHGKTPAERKELLKEVEKARQSKIHMDYLIVQQKMKNDERWVNREFEERQAILKLYKDVNEIAHPVHQQQIHEEPTEKAIM